MKVKYKREREREGIREIVLAFTFSVYLCISYTFINVAAVYVKCNISTHLNLKLSLFVKNKN